MLTGDDPIIDLLDLLRGEPGADGLDDVLVVSLAVETTINGVIVNTRSESGIVIVDDGEVLGFVVLEDYYPVIGKDLAVIGY